MGWGSGVRLGCDPWLVSLGLGAAVLCDLNWLAFMPLGPAPGEGRPWELLSGK